MSHKAFQLKSRIIFKISFEESLYEQAVMIRRKRMVHKRKNWEKPKEKNLFQGNFSMSKHWFDLGIYWVEENFSTIEPQGL